MKVELDRSPLAPLPAPRARDGAFASEMKHAQLSERREHERREDERRNREALTHAPPASPEPARVQASAEDAPRSGPPERHAGDRVADGPALPAAGEMSPSAGETPTVPESGTVRVPDTVSVPEAASVPDTVSVPEAASVPDTVPDTASASMAAAEAVPEMAPDAAPETASPDVALGELVASLAGDGASAQDGGQAGAGANAGANAGTLDPGRNGGGARDVGFAVAASRTAEIDDAQPAPVAHARIVVGEHDERVVVAVALRHGTVDVNIRAASEHLNEAAARSFDELDQALRKHGLSLGNHQTGDSRPRQDGGRAKYGRPAAEPAVEHEPINIDPRLRALA